ncbi:DUF924 family protein [Oleiagrimonas soli]|uniref:Membrane protein n=1 Tax=Oleiagrimonas soli TaxID=1543381 RepID=A0A099CU07_9GAMM|nr:DUF924 family protein [Oleiagrimonas soli]KGI77082.1 membrane protein [Oleiagrimonas soli]MBB6185383.1 uncharacterized protein (DUF924 family) [Oleiagrimonas soli]
MHDTVLRFWFDDIEPKQWWVKDADFDQTIRARFGDLLEQAAAGELSDWRDTPRGRLAEVIVLDQFSRNIHRDTRLSFARDPIALVLAQEAIRADAHEALTPIERNFLYMPFMHSESRAIHARAEALFRDNGLEDNYRFELKHRDIIERFGRYPHRNAILGRTSTPEEIAFLAQPGSSF